MRALLALCFSAITAAAAVVLMTSMAMAPARAQQAGAPAGSPESTPVPSVPAAAKPAPGDAAPNGGEGGEAGSASGAPKPAAAAPDAAEPEVPGTPPGAPKPEPGPLAPDGTRPANRESKPAPVTSTGEAICLLVESAAQAHGLPVEYFARLIWQESRFQVNAVGPVTRNGQRAQGIAQFMPATANARGAFDPFDPVAALPKSAEFLEELLKQFHNLGLAAAAYNAGPQRVREWLDGRSGLPSQTRAYVLAITGIPADEWATAGTSIKAPVRTTSCRELMALLKSAPSGFLGALERRIQEGTAKPWGVELSAGFSRDKVLVAYAGLEKTYRAILEKHDPIIIEDRFRSRGTQRFFQVRIGEDTRVGADTLCASLRKSGAACLVLRNLRGAVQPVPQTPAAKPNTRKP